MRNHHLSFMVVASILTAAATPALADNPLGNTITKGPIRVNLQPYVSGLVSPVTMVAVPGSPGQNVIVDQTGQLRLVNNGVLQTTPYLNLTSRLVSLMPGYDERGFLGVAFDPNFNVVGAPGFHTVYTYATEPVSGAATFTVPLQSGGVMDSQNVLSAWNIDTLARREILRIDKPQFNHNGGTIAFGPDGDLYLATGDGGNANDVGNGHDPVTGNAQNLTNALGKVLRIDVRGNNSANGQYGIPPTNPFTAPGQVKEIYAYGFRNPYEFSFDSATGNLIVADVGQNSLEEVDMVTKGANYGWHTREGTFNFNSTTGHVTAGAPAAGLTDPIAEYDHSQGMAIIGGFVYHGTGIPELIGKYVFGDLGTTGASPSGRLFYTDLSGPNVGQIHEFFLGAANLPLGIFLKGMGEDANGEIYVMGSTLEGPSGTNGVVFKLTEVPEPISAAILTLGLAACTLRRRRS